MKVGRYVEKSDTHIQNAHTWGGFIGVIVQKYQFSTVIDFLKILYVLVVYINS